MRIQPSRAITAAVIGNALEWFDLIVYGFFALTIARLFFPASSEAASLLLALASFGLTFCSRPIGALVIGSYGDRHGPRAALALSLMLMMVGTAAIAVAPTYATAGITAPIIILCARLLQGFSAGGEFGSATVFLSEQDPSRRGFYTSWQFASQSIAFLAAAGLAASLEAMLTREQMDSWGWRLPFVFGLMLGPMAYFIRRQSMDEPRVLRDPLGSPALEMFQNSRCRVVVASGVVACATVTAYTLLFMPTFAIRELGLPAPGSLIVVMTATAPQVVLVPLFGAISDRVGRVPVMMVAAILMLPASFGLFWWLTRAPSLGTLLIVQIVLGILLSAYCGGLAALMTELFPTRVRTTGTSICYALSVTVFGGFAPFIHAMLTEATGSSLAPSFYLTGSVAVSIGALVAAERLTRPRAAQLL